MMAPVFLILPARWAFVILGGHVVFFVAAYIISHLTR